MSDDLDLSIIGSGGRYRLIAPRHGVVVETSNLDAGLSEAVARVQAVGDLYRAEGLPLPVLADAPPSSGGRWPELLSFVASTILSFVIVSAFVAVGSIPFFSALTTFTSMADKSNQATERVLSFAADLSPDQLLQGLSARVLQMGANVDKMDPRRREELRVAIRNIMAVLGPAIEDVKRARAARDTRPPQPAP